MKTYTLKLKTTSTTNYNLYDGTTLVGDTDLATLFATAGSAYFVFDFNSLTPADTTSLTILDSNDTAVITNTGLSGIAENKNFKGTWPASATAFDSFTLLGGVAMDEAQLSRLVGVAKDGKVKTLTTADYNYPTTGTKISIAAWLLDSGVYEAGEDIKLRYSSSIAAMDTLGKGSLFIVSNRAADASNGYYLGQNQNGRLIYRFYSKLGGIVTNAPMSDEGVLRGGDAVNNLTSTDVFVPLSANQGKVLNDKIEGRILNGGTAAPTTSTKGSVGTQYNCVNNGTPEIYICTDTTGGTYTWTKVN